MKVYTVYLNGDQGWTDTKIDGFYNEVLNVRDEVEESVYIPTEEHYTSELSKLNIGDSYIIFVGETEIEVECVDMDEKEFNNLSEFTGW
jgi:hypothetical protein